MVRRGKAGCALHAQQGKLSPHSLDNILNGLPAARLPDDAYLAEDEDSEDEESRRPLSMTRIRKESQRLSDGQKHLHKLLQHCHALVQKCYTSEVDLEQWGSDSSARMTMRKRNKEDNDDNEDDKDDNEEWGFDSQLDIVYLGFQQTVLSISLGKLTTAYADSVSNICLSSPSTTSNDLWWMRMYVAYHLEKLSVLIQNLQTKIEWHHNSAGADPEPVYLVVPDYLEFFGTTIWP